MRQSRFETLHRPEWERLGELLERAERPAKLAPEERAELENLPALYRRLCGQYSLALRRRYTSGLAGQLHGLVLKGHRLLYQSRLQGLHDILLFCAVTFPRRVRQARLFVFVALALFLAPALTLGGLCYRDPTFIHSVMSSDQARNMERMYSGGRDKPIRREAATDFRMFGHYIQNNVGIGLRTFAGGLLFGLGAVLALVYNGVILGAVAGHLSHPPYAEAFWAFVPGHSPWELTAIVLCGASGLMLGACLLRPGPHRRLDALRLRAPEALQIALGAALMLVIAAVIEAFWSAQPLPAALKYAFSAANWVLVVAWLALSGRGGRGGPGGGGHAP